MAIERYDQGLSDLEIHGESYSPSGILRAKWITILASINPSGPTISGIYQTTIFNSAGDIVENTRGFGSLRLDGDQIDGWISDLPLPGPGGAWILRTVHYNLKRLNENRARSFQDAKGTKQAQEILGQLRSKCGTGTIAAIPAQNSVTPVTSEREVLVTSSDSTLDK
jgi:hypothetical protein